MTSSSAENRERNAVNNKSHPFRVSHLNILRKEKEGMGCLSTTEGEGGEEGEGKRGWDVGMGMVSVVSGLKTVVSTA